MRNLRVIEVGTDLAGAYCGRLFASAGGDVVCAEPSGGSPLRWEHPRLDVGGSEVSALWGYIAAGKRSVVAPAGHELDGLFAWADLVISSSDGDADEALARHDRVAAVNPAAVHVVTSGFGLTGPYRDWRHSPLLDWASGGQLYLTGEPDRAPLQGGGPWATFLVGATAAAGAAAAVIQAARTGEGQLVDVGAMEALAACHQWSLTMYTHTGCVKRRWGNRFGESFHPIALYRCADGWVSIVAPGPRQWEGLCLTVEMVELLADPEFNAPAVRFDRADEIDPRINAWLATRTCDEAVSILQEAGVPTGRVQTMSDVLADPHLGERCYWTAADHIAPDARFPRAPFRTDVAADIPPAPAPDVGAHTQELVDEIARGEPRPPLPRIDLSSVRMLEFGVAWAGPLAGRWLADLGVDVVTVEHPAARGWRRPPDPDGWQRGELPPPHVRSAVFPDATPGDRWWNRMGIWNKMNRNKRGVSFDARSGRGPELLQSLLGAADVVLHNFSPRGGKSLGIDWTSVRRANPNAVTVSMSGFGETGPLAGHLSFGPVLQAHAGFDEATGYEGGGPVRIGLAFPDAVGGVHGAFAALDALWEHELTGSAVHVDISQLETLLSLAGDMLLATSVTGHAPERHGNRSPSYAVQGVYRSGDDDAGNDMWLAVSVPDGECRQRLAEVVGHDSDDAIAAWASGRDAMAAAAELQAAGIAAFPAMTNKALVEDPHLRARGFIAMWDQVDVGPIEFPGFPVHFSAMDVRMRTAPGLGADNAAVLTEWLGLSDTQVSELVDEGVLADRPPDLDASP